MTAGSFAPTLAGIRVIDLSHLIAGPLCTMLLADAGADVIKVEPPIGDRARRRGAELLRDGAGSLSGYHAAYNRGKRALCVDLKNPEGRDTLLALLGDADVLIENFSPGVMDRLRLGMVGLRERFPRLVTVSLGVRPPALRDGAGALQRGLALVAEAESGIAGLNGPPVDFGFQLGDQVTGLYAYGAVMNALYRRAVSGVVSHVDVSMIASLIAANSTAVANFSLGGLAPADLPNALYGYFRTADGYVAIGLSTDEQWARLVNAVDDPLLIGDPRLSTYGGRNAQRDLIESTVGRWSSTMTSDQVVEILDRALIPCGRVNSVADIIAHRDDGYLCEVADAFGNRVTVPRNPMGEMNAPFTVPELGEHTESILSEVLHLDPARIDELLSSGAVVAWPGSRSRKSDDKEMSHGGTGLRR